MDGSGLDTDPSGQLSLDTGWRDRTDEPAAGDEPDGSVCRTDNSPDQRHVDPDGA